MARMSLGKFEPGVYNHSSTLKSHSNISDKLYDIKVPSIQALSNGISGADHSIKASHHLLKKMENDVKASETLKECDLRKYIHIEIHPNGGASVVHMYEEEFANLDSASKERLAVLFFKEVFREEPDNVAKHVIGIVHDSASYMPELVSHLAATKPNLDVKVSKVLVCEFTYNRYLPT